MGFWIWSGSCEPRSARPVEVTTSEMIEEIHKIVLKVHEIAETCRMSCVKYAVIVGGTGLIQDAPASVTQANINIIIYYSSTDWFSLIYIYLFDRPQRLKNRQPQKKKNNRNKNHPTCIFVRQYRNTAYVLKWNNLHQYQVRVEALLPRDYQRIGFSREMLRRSRSTRNPILIIYGKMENWIAPFGHWPNDNTIQWVIQLTPFHTLPTYNFSVLCASVQAQMKRSRI